MWGHWYRLFQILDDSAHESQSQRGSILACVLLSLVRNDPQSNLWFSGSDIEPGSLPTCKASTIPCLNIFLLKLLSDTSSLINLNSISFGFMYFDYYSFCRFRIFLVYYFGIINFVLDPLSQSNIFEDKVFPFIPRLLKGVKVV